METPQLVSELQRITGWTQEVLAHHLGVSYVTLNSWRNGRSQPRKTAMNQLKRLYADVTNAKDPLTTHPDTQAAKLRVFFTTPFAGKRRYQQFINAILATLRRHSSVVTPEDTPNYLATLSELQKQGLNKEQAHYAFIRQGIASADVVVIEATEEDIRVGHELTLALLFRKPTLVLAQNKDFSQFITHDLLTGASYKTTAQAATIVQSFLASSLNGRTDASMQTLDMSADSLHLRALAKLRRLAKQEPGQFGRWARDAEEKPARVAKEIEATLGRLKKQPAWSVFAPIYNEDSPDYIQSGVAGFIASILARSGIHKDGLVVEAACGTGALTRQLATMGFTNLAAFDSSRAMLSEAFRLCATMPNVHLFEANINDLALPTPADAIVWTDYSANFALDQATLHSMVKQLLDNLKPNGVLIFDIRTCQGWQIDFYASPITTFATERFQRIWLNHQDHTAKLIDFDVYIRTRDVDGAWAPWQRESMRERMWQLTEVMEVLAGVPNAAVQAVYGDDFHQLKDNQDTANLAYIVVRRSPDTKVRLASVVLH